ncbi:MAG: LacI family DNA-binding transcriptional regulator [Armatimonadota bacterium]|nr:LacI family DNA-binding transcriptional regulator [Armatimonadota bacterium]
MARQRADMDTIAREVGVSKTTVYRALHNKGRIHPQTRERILQVARELGYRPNLVARSLRVQKTSTVGLVVVGLAGSFYSHILEGVDGVAQSNQYGVLLACSYGNPRKEREIIQMLLDKRVDGLIVAPADPEENREFYEELIASQVSIVLIDRYIPGLPIDFVATNNELGGYLATRHLLQLGRRRIVFVSNGSRERRATSVIGRFEGYRRALAECNLCETVELGPGLPDILPEEEYAYSAVTHYLQQGGTMDGVFAVNDDVAYGAIRALRDHGLRVPEDVSVVGFDNQDTSAFIFPPLTTVAQPMYEIGRVAASLLLERIHKGRTAPQQQVLLVPQLVVRQSCGAYLKAGQR